MNPKQFLRELRAEVESHPAVNHPLLARLATTPFTREDYKVFGIQHYPLVGNFTTYMERLLIKGPDSDSKQWLAKVLVDEYGEGSDGKDHALLYHEFLVACGIKPNEELDTPLHPAVTDFILRHMHLSGERPFLVGLGALGPGHEWSIPKMFPPIVRGLRRAGFAESDILYFALHMEQDIDHGLWLEAALERVCRTEADQALVRQGALLSLAERASFFSGVQDKIVRWRQPTNIHHRHTGPRYGLRRLQSEQTLRDFAEVRNAAALRLAVA